MQKGELRTVLAIGWMVGAFFSLVASSWSYSFCVGALVMVWGLVTAWDEQRG